jgi:hypothetical protein
MVSYTDPGPIEYDGVLERSDVSNASAYVPFPFEVKGLFGVKGRVPVIAHFDGIEYRGSLVSYGGRHKMLMLREIRERLGKQAGDTVHVRIQLDTAVRAVELEADVEAAFTTAGVLDTFRGFSYSHQREYQQWFEGAKRSETRLARIHKATVMLVEGKRLR